MQIPPLSETLDAATFYSLSLVRVSSGEWQANLAIERGNSFRIRHGTTASEALSSLFAPTPSNDAPLAPPPY
jgi:hypothetical protein